MSIVIAALLCAAFFVMPVSAAEISVPRDFGTIQAAINAANDGDTVYVNSSHGTYYENVVVNKSINLWGNDDGSGWSVVNGNGGPGSVGFTLENDGINIQNFTVENAYFGIYIQSNDNQISQINVSGCDGGIYQNCDGGIYLYYSDGNTLTDINASDCDYGIYLYYSNGNDLSDVNASDCDPDGIYLRNSDGNTLTGINASGCFDGIGIDSSTGNTLSDVNASGCDHDGIVIVSSTGNTLSDVNASGCKFCIDLRNSDGNTLTGINASGCNNGIIIYSSTGNTLGDVNASGCNNGIDLRNSNGNTLTNITASDCDRDGIYLRTSDGNTLTGINASGSYLCIDLSNSDDNTLTGINASGCNYGIGIDNSLQNNLLDSVLYRNNCAVIIKRLSNNNTISDSFICENVYGVQFDDGTHNNTLMNLTIHDNGEGVIFYSGYNTLNDSHLINNTAGIVIADGIEGNLIYNNWFNNTINVDFRGSARENFWNITNTAGPNIVGGPNIGGNYWLDPDGTGFSQTHPDTDGDGFCDEAYELESTGPNWDFLPLNMGGVGLVADFSSTARSGYDPLTVRFTDESLGTPTNWTWDFGDRTPTSNEQDPSHTYTAAGKYDVTLTIESAGGANATITRIDYVTVYSSYYQSAGSGRTIETATPTVTAGEGVEEEETGTPTSTVTSPPTSTVTTAAATTAVASTAAQTATTQSPLQFAPLFALGAIPFFGKKK